MQIRTISNKVKSQFPDLNNMSENHFFQVWKSYEEELTSNLIDPTLPYLQFLSIGTLFITNNGFKKRLYFIKKALPHIEKWDLTDTVDFEKLKVKLYKFRNVINKKKEFYNMFLIYLKDWETNDLPFFERKVTEFDEYLKEIDNIIIEYDKRITTRNLEK